MEEVIRVHLVTHLPNGDFWEQLCRFVFRFAADVDAQLLQQLGIHFAEDGRVYGPVKTPEGFNFIRILKYTPGAAGDYFSVLPQLREKLENERRSASCEKYKLSLREKAIVRYHFSLEDVKQGK